MSHELVDWLKEPWRNPEQGTRFGQAQLMYTRTFRRIKNCDICLNTKITRASCKNTCWYSRAQSKNENHDMEPGDPLCSDIPEWLQEFRENLVDDRVPERRDSHASSSHEPSLESTPTRSVDLGKHSVKNSLP